MTNVHQLHNVPEFTPAEAAILAAVEDRNKAERERRRKQGVALASLRKRVSLLERTVQHDAAETAALKEVVRELRVQLNMAVYSR